MTIVALVLPIVLNLLNGFVDRAIKSWKSSAMGAGLGAVSYGAVVTILDGMGCSTDVSQLAGGVAAAGNLLQGVLSHDTSRLLEIAHKDLTNGGIETTVMAQQTDKNGNPIPRSLPVILLAAFLLAGCSPKAEQDLAKVEATVLKIEGEAVALFKQSCTLAPEAAAGLGAVKSLITDSQVQAGVSTAEGAIALQVQVCKALGH